MIYNSGSIYAKVWDIKTFEKYMELRISTSEKDQEGNYLDSTWFPRVIGHAFNTLKDKLKVGDRILISKSKFTNEKYTAKDGSVKSAFRFVILDADLVDSTPKSEPAASPAPAETNAEEESPW